MKPLYRFQSLDGQYGLTLSSDAVKRMLAEAQKADGHETGGILVGLYNHGLDTAIVTSAQPPPEDSSRSRSAFWRGIVGVRELLQHQWSQPLRTYYLGEWHVHPGFSPEKSTEDDVTMCRRGLREAFNCAVPILVILGGNPPAKWILRAWVYPSDQPAVHLIEQGEL